MDRSQCLLAIQLLFTVMTLLLMRSLDSLTQVIKTQRAALFNSEYPDAYTDNSEEERRRVTEKDP